MKPLHPTRLRWTSRLLLMTILAVVFSAIVCVPFAALAADEAQPQRLATVALDDKPVLPSHGSRAGTWFFAESEEAQLALFGHPPCRAIASLDKSRRATLRGPVGPVAGPCTFELHAIHLDGAPAQITLRLPDGTPVTARVDGGGKEPVCVQLAVPQAIAETELCIDIAAPEGATSIQIDRLQRIEGSERTDLSWTPQRRDYPQPGPVACSPTLRPPLQEALVEWDWRMQDGIGTPQEPRSYQQAIDSTLTSGSLLLDDLKAEGVEIANHAAAWSALAARRQAMQEDTAATEPAWEALWLDIHRARREMALANPLADVGPVVFAKRVPSVMAHQLTQYYGYTAQPGGGLFVLDQPGRSMRVRQLAGSLPEGSYLHPEVSFDGEKVYFAFCECDTPPKGWGDPAAADRHYHLYVARRDGSEVKRLTDGPYDDFSPTYLPTDQVLFVSTRRGGYHRCGGGPCYVYTLARMDADGGNPHPISFHETQEWDPVLLNDGRVLYTRWDYVDRNAVFYQQLWTARQDGSCVRIFYGNNTFNPVGTWESRPVPDSQKVMATAAPHHGMTAGSIVLLDPTKGVDGPAPIARLTPGALFPESEVGLMRGTPVDKPTQFDDPVTGAWGPQSWSADTRKDDVPAEAQRWPGHCYRSPYPLSETYFLTAYSYDRLRGEPGTNLPNMFGLYLCDAFGNKELLYRDPNISSQWPIPLRPRTKPPVLEMSSHWAESTPEQPEGTFFLQNVYESWPKLPEVEIHQLRIVQVLPKTTPHANNPRVGAANASPGKQVLGTVPVEPDGSAYFRVPARTPILFQALDAQGRAVQTMRSLTYLQPGEQVSCIGCHERRDRAILVPGMALAIGRAPSTIAPGPDGSNPLSYPLLVQPVLDQHCVTCHNAEKPEGNVILTGEPEGAFSRSYNALVGRVAYTAWGMPNDNHEPLTEPDTFGARASNLTKLLDKGHYDVQLSAEEWDRIVTWIDANALFYGTFNPADQAKQLRGERIAGPDLE